MRPPTSAGTRPAHWQGSARARTSPGTSKRCSRASTGELRAGDHALLMSNGGFGGLHERLLAALGARARKQSSRA